MSVRGVKGLDESVGITADGAGVLEAAMVLESVAAWLRWDEQL